jgi:hypothetical protein
MQRASLRATCICKMQPRRNRAVAPRARCVGHHETQHDLRSTAKRRGRRMFSNNVKET